MYHGLGYQVRQPFPAASAVSSLHGCEKSALTVSRFVDGQWASFLAGMVALALAATPWVLFHFGPTIRAKVRPRPAHLLSFLFPPCRAGNDQTLVVELILACLSSASTEQVCEGARPYAGRGQVEWGGADREDRGGDALASVRIAACTARFEHCHQYHFNFLTGQCCKRKGGPRRAGRVESVLERAS